MAGGCLFLCGGGLHFFSDDEGRNQASITKTKRGLSVCLLLGKVRSKTEGATQWAKCSSLGEVWLITARGDERTDGVQFRCFSMLISDRYDYGVDGITTSKKKLSKAQGHRSLCLTMHEVGCRWDAQRQRQTQPDTASPLFTLSHRRLFERPK